MVVGMHYLDVSWNMTGIYQHNGVNDAASHLTGMNCI